MKPIGKYNRREFLRLAGATGLALSLPAPIAYSQQRGNISLDFPSWQVDEAGTGDWWRALIAEFKRRHPGVDIIQSGITPPARFTEQMVVRLAAGRPPDILHLPTRNALEFAKRGWIAPIEDRLAKTDVLDTWTPLQNFLHFDRHWYGVLLLGFTQLLFYNKRLLDQAGVKPPSTTTEFLQAAKTTTRRGQFGLTSPTAEPVQFFIEVTTYIIGAGGHWSSREGRITANSEPVVKALTQLAELFDAGAIPIGLGRGEAFQVFFEGKAAMMIDGPFLWSLIKQRSVPDVANNLGVAKVPFPRIAGGVSNSVHIPAGISREKADLVWEFILLLTRPEWQSAYARMAELPPPRKDRVTERVKKEVPHIAFFADDVDKAVNFIPPGFEDNFTKFAQLVSDEVIKLATMKAKPSSVADAIQRKLETEFRR